MAKTIKWLAKATHLPRSLWTDLNMMSLNNLPDSHSVIPYNYEMLEHSSHLLVSLTLHIPSKVPKIKKESIMYVLNWIDNHSVPLT